MKISDIIKLSFSHIYCGGVKTFLCIIAMLAGVFSFCIACYAGEFATNTVEYELNKIGIKGIAFYSSNLSTLTQAELRSVSDVKGVENIMPMSFITGNIKMKNSERTALVIGADQNLQKVWNVELLYGRSFNYNDIFLGKNVVIVDSEYANNIYHRDNVVGKTLTVEINGITDIYEIIGVILPQKESIQMLVGSQVPEIVYIPSAKTEKIDMLAVTCMTGYDTEKVSIRVQNKIKDQTGISVNYKNLDVYIDSFSKIVDIVALLGAIFASIALIVGGIGVMSNMLNKTEQRKYEIGVYLSLGASKRDICLMFLFESILICLIGGVLGWALSTGVFEIFNTAFQGTGVSNSIVATYGVIASCLCGVIFGLFPAAKAAMMKPIDAIRG